METLDLVIRRLAPAALLTTVLLAGGAARGDDGALDDPNGSYDDGAATQVPDDSGWSWYTPPQDESNQGLYQQGNGTGENYGDGSGSYGNSNTGTGVITDGQGGVWVQPDPGGYTAPSE